MGGVGLSVIIDALTKLMLTSSPLDVLEHGCTIKRCVAAIRNTSQLHLLAAMSFVKLDYA
jgi:hypothetical protein